MNSMILSHRCGNASKTVTQYVLGKGYQTVEWIQGTGANNYAAKTVGKYLDTGVIDFNTNYKMEFNMWTSKFFAIGNYLLTGGNEMAFLKGDGSTGNTLQCVYQNNTWRALQYTSDKDKVDVVVQGSSIMIDGTPYNIPGYVYGSFSTSNQGNLMLMAANDPNNRVMDFSSPMGYFKLTTDGGVPVRKMYACYHTVSGAIGAYDLVTDTFFPVSAGSRTITKGNDYNYADYV